MLLDAVCTSKDDLILLFEAIFGHNQMVDSTGRKNSQRVVRSSVMSNRTKDTVDESEYIRASRIMNDPIEQLVMRTSQYTSTAPFNKAIDTAQI